MRLVSYAAQDAWRAGVLHDNRVYDLVSLLPHESPELVTVRGTLGAFGDRLDILSERVAQVLSGGAIVPVVSPRLGPPVPDPRKVICIGLNYSDHVAETGRALPQHPDVFTKFASTLIGPDSDIAVTGVTENLDFEGELAVVIGRDCRHVREEDALDVVAGFTILNDITARDLQYRGTQWVLGKSVDSSTPVGPALVTRDEIPDPQSLDIRTTVNGVIKQTANTSSMIFSVRRLVAELSRTIRLEPGDLIATGTPEGIGAKRTPPEWLRVGDIVEVAVTGLGTLSNAVR